MRQFLTIAISFFVLSGCVTGTPGDLQPVQNFDVERYSGTWYEVYRLDHPFERGLSDVTATYTLEDDGSVKVENEGMREDGSMSYIAGRAEFQGEPTVGSLKVSFFGPFFSGYHVIALDQENYDYAMVAGGTFDYLWILSRTPDLDEGVLDMLLMQAEDAGYQIEDLILVGQS
mgnify:CR=1 FL=1|jgi:apolipoprotein D and lipocalin family protein